MRNWEKESLWFRFYPHSEQYALEHEEIEEYWSSFRENVACSRAIHEAAAQHYDYDNYTFHTGAAAKQIVEQCGMERALFVLASTVREKSWDGRISMDNIVWAEKYPVPQEDRRNTLEYCVDTVHPGLLNMLVKEMRKQAELEKRPSIREQLAVRPEQNERHASNPKHQEEAR